MNVQTFKILDDKAQADIAALWSEYVKAAKAAEDAGEDTGRFKVIATSDDMDRDGEVISVDGWDFTSYEKNPVVLWGHDFYSMPIGKVTKLTREGNKIIAEGIFAPTERGQEVRKAYDGEFLNTVSVGFIPRERKGNTITKSELLELSFVPVPANANAVALRAVEELAVKMAKGVKTTDEKGVVSDVLDAVQGEGGSEATFNAKWGNISQVSQIVGALWEVYMRPETGVDEFDGLLKETIDLLSGLLGARVQGEGAVAQSVKSVDGNAYTQSFADVSGMKVGRVLSSKNRELISTCVEAMQNATAGLNELLDATDSKEDEEKGTEGNDVSAKGHSLDTEEVVAAVLRGIDTAVGKKLRDLKRGN